MPRRRVRPEQVAEAQARLASVVRTRQPTGWVPPSESPAEPPPESPPGSPPESPPAAEPDAEPALEEPEPVPPDVPAQAAPSPGPTSFLPATLLGGRWDPGRRGALALGAVALLAAIVAAVVLLRGRPTEVPAPAAGSDGVTVSSPAASGATGGAVVVDVAGKVRRPGLVRLPAGARVDDALRAAGGLRPGATLGLLNLARRLVDGEQVLVGVDATAAGAVGGGAAAPGVDLNTADAAALDGLPGIGPVLAQHIVDWRTEHGHFASVDQLREVPGIGESKFASLKSKVRV